MLHVCFVNKKAINEIVDFVKSEYDVTVPGDKRKLVSIYECYDYSNCERAVTVIFTGDDGASFTSDKIKIPNIGIVSIYGKCDIKLQDNYCNDLLIVSLD